MPQALREIDVIRRVRQFLLDEGIAGQSLRELYTDAHPTLTDERALGPFQRFALDLDGMTIHPDLVGRLDDGETTVAIEAKGGTDLLRGLGQVAAYRFGFHRTLLAVAGAPPRDLVVLAHQQHVGVLAVMNDRVEQLSVPPPHLPLYRHATSIRRQFVTAEALRVGFSFNMPTHYVSIAILMREHASLARDEAERKLREQYPVLPGDTIAFNAVLRGAHKLGVVTLRGDTIERTTVGEAAGRLLPDIGTLAATHQTVVASRGRVLLHQQSPSVAAVLRWLLASDPVVALIQRTLADLGRRVMMPELVRAAGARDRAQALATFFQPAAVGSITDQRGALQWEHVQPHHYRSTTYYQYKSMMRQAGVLAPHPLGAASSTHYIPERDVWELA